MIQEITLSSSREESNFQSDNVRTTLEPVLESNDKENGNKTLATRPRVSTSPYTFHDGEEQNFGTDHRKVAT